MVGLVAVVAFTLRVTFTKLKKRMEQVAEHIAGYLQDLDTADRQEGEGVEARSGRLVEKVERLRAQMQKLKAMEAQIEAAPDNQVSLTDPDARSMATSGRGSGIVGYNVQSAVEGEHHLIVAHDVVMTGHDRDQLARMAGKARDAMGVETLDVLADRGYFSGEEILACEPLGVTPFVPKPLTSGAKGGRPVRQAGLRLSAGQRRLSLPGWRTAASSHDDHGARAEDPPLLGSGQLHRLSPQGPVHTHPGAADQAVGAEAVVDALQVRMDLRPRAMRDRRSLVEHPFGTIKAWMGHTHFLTRRLPNVKTEISLHVLAYNMKRAMAVLGTKPLLEAIRT